MLEICEHFSHVVSMHDNLGDLMMEIASGDHGMNIVEKMRRQHYLNFEEETIKRWTSEKEENLLDLISKSPGRATFVHSWLLFLPGHTSGSVVD